MDDHFAKIRELLYFEFSGAGDQPFIEKHLDAIEAELKRYREREPLVQEFLTALRACPHDDALDELCARCGEKYDRLRGFKLSASAAAGDESA